MQMKFGIFTVMKILIVIFWVLMSYNIRRDLLPPSSGIFFVAFYYQTTSVYVM